MVYLIWEYKISRNIPYDLCFDIIANVKTCSIIAIKHHSVHLFFFFNFWQLSKPIIYVTVKISVSMPPPAVYFCKQIVLQNIVLLSLVFNSDMQKRTTSFHCSINNVDVK